MLLLHLYSDTKRVSLVKTLHTVLPFTTDAVTVRVVAAVLDMLCEILRRCDQHFTLSQYVYNYSNGVIFYSWENVTTP